MVDPIDIFRDERYIVHCGDCLAVMAAMEPASVDLVFGSPPYENARTYGIGFKLRGQEWVDWMVEVVRAGLRVSRGLVAFVVEGRTKKFRWSATPALLMADLHRAGVHLRKPPAFCRAGIPGSGGPDWFRNDYEFIVCATQGGKLPWSDNAACGTGCAYPVGGAMSNRTQDGQRRNRETYVYRMQSRRKADGKRVKDGLYKAPRLANPGNLIHCKVGGGLMGSPLAHENEAPFPESLAERFVRSFCPPGGVILDPFGGSGTTMAVAMKWGRQAISIDVRESQVILHQRRTTEVAESMPLLNQGGAGAAR